MHLEGVHVLLREHFRDFTAPVGAEVKAHHHVIFLNGSNGLTVGSHLHDGFQKLIRYSVFILFLNGLNQVCEEVPMPFTSRS